MNRPMNPALFGADGPKDEYTSPICSGNKANRGINYAALRKAYAGEVRPRRGWWIFEGLALALALACVAGAFGVLAAGNQQRTWLALEVRAYCPCRECCGTGALGITASGGSAFQPGVAVAKAWLGRRFSIPGCGEQVLADDTGPFCSTEPDDCSKFPRIEVRFFNLDDPDAAHARALDWGRQVLWCEVEK